MLINQLKTFVLLVAIGGLLVCAGRFIGGNFGALVAFGIALLVNFLAYFYSDSMVLAMYGAKPLNADRFPQIYEIVSELSFKAGIPQPKLYLIDHPMANAFATGRNPEHSSIAVTAGIIDLLTVDELRGVLAHEISHIKNRDILIATVAATFAMAIGYIASMIRWGFIFGSRRDDNREGSGIGAFFAALLMPVAATLIQLAISRAREFQADQTGAQISQAPLSLASALEKISYSAHRQPLTHASYAQQATSSMFICNPFSGQSLISLFSTHPPISERVKQLRKMV